MRFKVQRTLLDNSTRPPFADSAVGANAVQAKDSDWHVEIADLDALLAFTLQHGELVTGTDGVDHYIEIYDADRESREGERTS